MLDDKTLLEAQFRAWQLVSVLRLYCHDFMQGSVTNTSCELLLSGVSPYWGVHEEAVTAGGAAHNGYVAFLSCPITAWQ